MIIAIPLVLTPALLHPKILHTLEINLLSRLDELWGKLLNVENVIIKNLQSENERPREKLSSLENKVVSLEAGQNMLEPYGRRKNINISGIPDSVEQN